MKYVLVGAALFMTLLFGALQVIKPAKESVTELYFSNYSDLPTVSTFAWPIPQAVQTAFDQQGRVFSTVTTRTGGRKIVIEEYYASPALFQDTNLTQNFPGRITDATGTVTAIYRMTLNETDPDQNAVVLYPFSFNIHNLEGKNQQYTYIVTQIANNETRQVTKGNVQLADGDTAVIKAAATATKPFGRMEVDVELQGDPAKIHFWIEEEP